ncbi:hypothetical protein BGX38DRAFT_554478 [Terfezia claveryi]|nr:hypothetical protein BGX38DRAFT_554478 [Terfezia claveryi]
MYTSNHTTVAPIPCFEVDQVFVSISTSSQERERRIRLFLLHTPPLISTSLFLSLSSRYPIQPAIWIPSTILHSHYSHLDRRAVVSSVCVSLGKTSTLAESSYQAPALSFLLSQASVSQLSGSSILLPSVRLLRTCVRLFLSTIRRRTKNSTSTSSLKTESSLELFPLLLIQSYVHEAQYHKLKQPQYLKSKQRWLQGFLSQRTSS